MFEQLITDTAARLNLPVSSVSVLVQGLMTLVAGERTWGGAGILDTFRQAGHGAAIDAWLGGDAAAPITPVQVETVLGPGAIGSLSASSGLTRTAASAASAYLLPRLVGQLASAGTLSSSVALRATSPLRATSSATPLRVPPPDPPSRVQRRRRASWLPWAAAAGLALAAWAVLSRGPAGTLDATLRIVNRDGKVTYSGLVRDDGTRQAVVSALRASFGPANVSGALRVDANVRRAGWDSQLADLLAILNVPGADFSLNGDAVNVGGWLTAAERRSLIRLLRRMLGPGSTVGLLEDAAVDAARDANRRAVAALGLLGEHEVAPTAIVQAMNVAVIDFASGSAEIPQDAMEIIRRSADALRRVPPGTRIEIGGHTDNAGDPAANLTLSQSRAEVVRDALVAAGAPAGVLTTAGYGEARPRASNDTEYGRFQNRRIELALID